MIKLGSKPYSIEYLDHVLENDISKLPKVIKTRIKKAIETRLLMNPISLGKPLRYSFKGHRRIRVGDYRVVYRIHVQKKIVTIVYIRHRKDIYRTENMKN